MRDRRENRAPAELRRLQQVHKDAALGDKTWALFLTDYRGDVTTALNAEIAKVEKYIRSRSGPAKDEPNFDEGEGLSKSLLPEGVDLDQLTLSLLDKEVKRLGQLIGVDKAKRKAFGKLTQKISSQETAIAKLDREIKAGEQARKRIQIINRDSQESLRRGFRRRGGRGESAQRALRALSGAPHDGRGVRCRSCRSRFVET